MIEKHSHCSKLNGQIVELEPKEKCESGCDTSLIIKISCSFKIFRLGPAWWMLVWSQHLRPSFLSRGGQVISEKIGQLQICFNAHFSRIQLLMRNSHKSFHCYPLKIQMAISRKQRKKTTGESLVTKQPVFLGIFRLRRTKSSRPKGPPPRIQCPSTSKLRTLLYISLWSK